MMRYGLIVGAALALAACETTAALDLDDPAAQRLFAQSTPEYYATLSLANRIARSCPRYNYNAGLDVAMNEARNAVGRGSLSAASLSTAIEIETDVAERSFSAKHNVTLDIDDLCAAGDAEVLEGSAISALLVPV